MSKSEESYASFFYTWKLDDFQERRKHGPSFAIHLNMIEIECNHQLRIYPLFWNFTSSLTNHSLLNVKARVRYSLLEKNKRIELTFDDRFRDVPSEMSTSYSDHVNKYHIWEKPNDLPADAELTVLISIELLAGEKARRFHELVHRNRVSYDLGSLFESRCCSDVKIIVQGEEIPAHRGLLACRSPVFARMFQLEMKETRECLVEIKDFDYDVVMEMLRFMYTGAVGDVGDGTAVELLRAADKYDIGDLKVICEDVIYEGLEAGNAVDVLILADRYNAVELKRLTMKFIVDNSRGVVKTQAFKTISDQPQLLTEVCEALAAK